MIYFLKHFKGIAYFLIILILFQSCVAYKDTSSTIYQASSEKDMPIQIFTKDGNGYKLRWIEVQGENIFSIRNAKRVYLDKNDIVQYVIQDPEPRVVTFNQALNQRGVIQLLTKEDKDTYIKHQFIRISEKHDIIIGYEMTGKDTLTVNIPIDQIAMIQLKDKKKSNGRTIGLVVGVGFGIALIAGFIVVINALAEGGWYSQ